MKRSLSSTNSPGVVVEAKLLGDPRQSRIAMLHRSMEQTCSLGVVIIVGGLQYRVGSQRYFVELANNLAASGVNTIRYDHIGCGDTYGEAKHFSANQSEISEVIALMFESCDDLSGVVLWGLCDGATAASEYAHVDSRVKGLVLVNAWIHSPWRESKNIWAEYYSKRLFDIDAWLAYLRNPRKLSVPLQSLRSWVATLREDNQKANQGLSVIENLSRFRGGLLNIVSGGDVTGLTFIDFIRVKAPDLHKRLNKLEIAGADHTFTQGIWRKVASENTVSWIYDLHRNLKKELQ